MEELLKNSSRNLPYLYREQLTAFGWRQIIDYFLIVYLTILVLFILINVKARNDHNLNLINSNNI